VVPYVLWFKLIPTDRAWAEHPEFMNDRIAMVADLFATSRNHYLKSRRMIKTLDGVLDLYQQSMQRVEVKPELILEALASLKGYDSPAKYPIATMLRQVYSEITARQQR